MWWHAYNYAFRRVFLKNREEVYPADPTGDWFSQALADQAERMELADAQPQQENITPAMRAYQRGDYKTAQRWDDQDRQRRKAEGTPEYVDVCMRQIRANLAAFASKVIK